MSIETTPLDPPASEAVRLSLSPLEDPALSSPLKAPPSTEGGRANMVDVADVSEAPLLPSRITRFGTKNRIQYAISHCIWSCLFFLAPSRLIGKPREIALNGTTSPPFFPPNVVHNARYNIFTLIPCVLYQQFRFFFNLFYLVVALAQCIPQLRIGPLFTYITPLAVVLLVTILKEAYDDYQRRLRDAEANAAAVDVWVAREGRFRSKPAAKIRVGDLLLLHSDQRVPCDVILLKTSNRAGTTFLRTDQLDGEIDWKLRRAVGFTQSLITEIASCDAWVSVEAPRRDIYDFVGTFYRTSDMNGNGYSRHGSQSRLMMIGASDETTSGSSTGTLFEPEQVLEGGSRYTDDDPSSSSSSSLRRNHALNEARSLQLVGGTNSGDETLAAPPSARDMTVIPIKAALKRSRSAAEFAGVISEPLGLDNVLWASTVVTDGPVWALAIYTGVETRSALNTSRRETKTGLFDLEINRISKVLFGMLMLAAMVLMFGKGFEGTWLTYAMRFVLLLSNIIPISLRVNLDLAKAYYALTISHDPRLPETVVRNSSIPEELGRIDFILTDKTGTLTQNTMQFKKLHIGRVQFGEESFEEIRGYLQAASVSSAVGSSSRKRMEVWEVLRRTLLGLAVCHNVTPVLNETTHEYTFQAASPDEVALVKFASEMGLRLIHRTDTLLVLLSPDGCHLVFDILFCFPFCSEAKRMGCIVQLADIKVMTAKNMRGGLGGVDNEGLKDGLIPLSVQDQARERGQHHIEMASVAVEGALLPSTNHVIGNATALDPSSPPQYERRGSTGSGGGVAPSYGGISAEVGKIFFFLKGAETVMLTKVEQRSAHWLQEECDNFARVGLRTLVLAMKELTPQQLEKFRHRYHEAQTSMHNRSLKVRAAIDSLESQMVLLGLTGVEDKLQHDVPQTLEAFRHAGIRVWMLTGDKMETATCIAVAAGLKSRQQSIVTLAGQDFGSPAEMQEALESFAMGPTETVLVLDGAFIELCLRTIPELFVKATCQAPAVICCRCSPTQKEAITRAIQDQTNKRTACVGDGGNDVAMIQASTCGIGIVGKEGRHASLAADFSITQFSHLHRLLFWHGRNCFQRSAKLAHFVMHRGLIIATIQVIFSAIFYFIPMAIFQGWLTVGYATYYTMLPVFSLVLDIELSENVVFMFPELFESLKSGRLMSNKIFFSWLFTSVYQGAVIMLGSMLLFENEFDNIVSITFTSLVLAELLNVAISISTWHWLMVCAQLVTVLIYILSMVLLPNYFNLLLITSPIFWWKVGVLTAVSWVPLYLFKLLMKVLQPTRDAKLNF